MKTLLQNIQKRRLIISISLFTLVFVLTRLPYYLFSNIPYIFDDAYDYNAILSGFFTGNLTNTASFGYPAILALITIFTRDAEILILYQSILSLICSLFFIYTIYKHYSKLTIPATIALLIFSVSIPQLNFETAFLTEFMYSNFFLLFISFFILAVKTKKTVHIIFCGATLMFIPMIRPAGMFMFGIAILILLFMFLRRYSWRVKIFFVVPVIALFLMQSLYNYLATNKKEFTFTENIAKQNLSFADPIPTVLQPDESFPEHINKSIEKGLSALNERDRQILDSWNVDDLWILYFTKSRKVSGRFHSEMRKHDPDFTKFQLQDIALQAIRNNPGKYFKWIYTMFVHYFRSIDVDNRYTYPFLEDYETCFKGRIGRYFYDKRSYMNKTGRFDWRNGFLHCNKYSPDEASKKAESFKKSSYLQFMQGFSTFYSSIFERHFWIYLYFLVFFVSVFVFIKSKLKNEDAFIIFIILLLPITAAIAIALVHNCYIRYAYPLNFVYYLAPVFLPVLIKTDKLPFKKWFQKKKEQKSKQKPTKTERLKQTKQQKRKVKPKNNKQQKGKKTRKKK